MLNDTDIYVQKNASFYVSQSYESEFQCGKLFTTDFILRKSYIQPENFYFISSKNNTYYTFLWECVIYSHIQIHKGFADEKTNACAR